MTAERRTDHATRAALLRLRMAEYRVADLLVFRRDIEDGAAAAGELSLAIDAVTALLRSQPHETATTQPGDTE